MLNRKCKISSGLRCCKVDRVTMIYSSAVLLPVVLMVSGCPNSTNPNADTVRLRPVADGLVAPLGLSVAPDGSNRLFIVDQVGSIRIVDSSGHLLADRFLDLSDRIVDILPAYDERGLLGLAFHPRYAENGRFFVVYNAPPPPDGGDVGYPIDSLERVSEFRVTGDANVADASSERILLELAKPQFNHNGGNVAFGPTDGFLYVSIGDGGGANDVGPGHNPEIGNGQDSATLFGKILRINVDAGDPYAIPVDNPFVTNSDFRPEIWALGLRNPWRFSFDRQDSTRVFIADVGQDLFEEVDLGRKGANYGWHVREGTHCFSAQSPTNPPDSCASIGPHDEPLVDPLFDYSHLDGAGNVFRTSIIGGYLYRGSAIPGLVGQYIFGDYSAGFEGTGDGTVLSAHEESDGSWTLRELAIEGTPDGRIHRFVRGFGEDSHGELYILTTTILGPSGTSGEVFQIQAARN
jgi:glucose/arabinose dehydrogenase